MLKLNHVSLTFNQGTQDEKKAIDDVTLHVKKGDFISIIGANGAGKSTLFNVIAGTFITDSGNIYLDVKSYRKTVPGSNEGFCAGYEHRGESCSGSRQRRMVPENDQGRQGEIQGEAL